MIEFALEAGDDIRIGDVRVVVTKVRDGWIWVAVGAPDEVLILRGELVGTGYDPRKKGKPCA